MWVRKSVQKTVHFLVSLGNFSPRHMCVVSRSSKMHTENFGSFIPKISQFQTGPPVSPPGTTISGRATGFPHLLSTVLTAFTDNTAGHGFPALLHIKSTSPGSRVTAFHGQPYPNERTKMIYTATELGDRSSPKLEGFILPLFTPKVLSIFHH